MDHNDDIIRIPFGDELDLHHFSPSDAIPLLREFMENAVSHNMKTIRIIHGKGKSVIKGMVLKELRSHPDVLSFTDDAGNWGATIVRLK